MTVIKIPFHPFGVFKWYKFSEEDHKLLRSGSESTTTLDLMTYETIPMTSEDLSQFSQFEGAKDMMKDFEKHAYYKLKPNAAYVL